MKLAILAILLFVSLSLSAYETVIVRQDGTGDFTTISGAFYYLQSAGESGQIIVAPGTYSNEGPLSWGEVPNVHIKIWGASRETCIIDFANRQSPIIFQNGFAADPTLDVIQNLTIRNSTVHAVSIFGGNPKITNCVFEYCGTSLETGSNSLFNGAAIYCQSGCVVENCNFHHNTAKPKRNTDGTYSQGCLNGFGGAVYVYNTSTIPVQFKNCVFANNKARDAGAMYLSGTGPILVSECTFTGNKLELLNSNSDTYQLGYSDVVTIRNCIDVEFSGNVLVDNFGSFDPTISLLELYYLGGGSNLAVVNSINVKITNNIIDSDLYNPGESVVFNIPSMRGIHLQANPANNNIDILNNFIYSNLGGIINADQADEIRNNFAYNNFTCITHQDGHSYITNNIDNMTQDGYLGNRFNHQPDVFSPIYYALTEQELDAMFMDYDGGNYEPKWTAQGRSRLIDAGYANILDSDGTPSDIGPNTATAHDFETYSLAPNTNGNVNWVSFPVVDKFYTADNDVLDFFIPLLNPTIFDVVAWGGGWITQLSTGGYGLSNSGADHQVNATRGYKIRTQQPVSFTKIGSLAPADTDISLTTGVNWVGYFLPDMQDAVRALTAIHPYINRIKHKNWCVVKLANGTWAGQSSGTANVRPIVHYGEMVEITCTSPCTFQWDGSGGPVTPNGQTAAKSFTYQEDFDYWPVFLEFDENDLPGEVGMFVGDKCVGATAVSDAHPQILAYVYADDVDLSEPITFQTVSPGKRDTEERDAYRVLNPETMRFEDTKVHPSTNPIFGYVSFAKGETPGFTPAATALQANVPNPFNPSTTLRYSLAESGRVSLTVYNVRGQLVKTLVNCDMEAGYHDIVWDGRDDAGSSVASGVYFSRLTTGGKTQTRKMMLLK